MKSFSERQALRDEILSHFNPNENGLGTTGIFGLPFGEEESEVILLPIPWETTVSYQSGCAEGPECIRTASEQIDLYDKINNNAWQNGYFMRPNPAFWADNCKILRKKAEQYIQALTNGEDVSLYKDTLAEINQASKSLNEWIKLEALAQLSFGKKVGLVGGEHSCPYGLIEALTSYYSDFGILHFDAHADLRQAYEGFDHSHASIFYNVSKLEEVKKIIQVGLRDVSESEVLYASESNQKILQYFMSYIHEQQFKGKSLSVVYDEIITGLPQNVYISFDIDGLEPHLCPGTGTPVAGGFQFNEAMYLIEKVVQSGRNIIGFDLCEVAPGDNPDWNGNVGARVLYKLCGYLANGEQIGDRKED